MLNKESTNTILKCLRLVAFAQLLWTIPGVILPYFLTESIGLPHTISGVVSWLSKIIAVFFLVKVVTTGTSGIKKVGQQSVQDSSEQAENSNSAIEEDYKLILKFIRFLVFAQICQILPGIIIPYFLAEMANLPYSVRNIAYWLTDSIALVFLIKIVISTKSESKENVTTPTPIFVWISCLAIVIGDLVGLWLFNVGFGFGRGTHVAGDAILGGLVIVGGLVIGLLTGIIAFFRKERPLMPFVFIAGANILFIGYRFFIAFVD